MIVTWHGNYLTETPENAKDVEQLKRRFPHLPAGPVSYIPEKSKRDKYDDWCMRMRAIYPGVRIPREY